MNSGLKKVLWALIGLNVFLSSWFFLHKDLLFHTDIARDFLLLQDVVLTHHLPLIGPRAGGITGVFHGPLWIYLNLPFFILGRGNPVVVELFWIILSVFSLASFYYIGRKIFNQNIALFSTVLFSSYLIGGTRDMFNPDGATILFPIYFYMIYRYLQDLKMRYLMVGFFLIGLIIQFEVAFGGPILALTLLYLGFFLAPKKKLWHLVSIVILIIPLSTYILFEVRHDFLQVRSIVHFFTTRQIPMNDKYEQPSFFIINRVVGLFSDGFNLSSIPYLSGLIAIPSTIYVLVLINKKKLKDLQFYKLAAIYYLGFWFLTFFFKGVIWNYYYAPFLPLSVLFFVSLSKYVKQTIFLTIFAIVFGIQFFISARDIFHSNTFIGKSDSSWRFEESLATSIFKDAPADFGYYIFTPDQYGYGPRFAMNYIQKNYPDKQAHPYEKKEVTYLIIAPPPDEKPFLNGEWWKINQVKLNKKPDWVRHYSNRMKVEKYTLTDKEQKTPSDPNMIVDLHFR